MRKSKIAMLTMLALIAGTSASLGQPSTPDTRTPLEKFIGDATFHRVQCGLMMSIWLKNQQPEYEPGMCIDTAKKALSPLYKDAVAGVAKNAAAVTAAKEFYAYWMTAMDGIIPSKDERKISYDERQSRMDDRVSELANRLTIEAE